MQPSKVSVILPIRNGEKYVKEAIDSVLAQTYPHFELVIIDASDDSTPQIVASYNDARISYHRQRSKGSVGGYNEGLDLVNGDYVTFIHHDDFYVPDKLYEQVTMIERFSDVDCVYNDIRYGDAEMNFIKYDRHEEFYRRSDDLRVLIFLSQGIRNGGMNILIKRDFIEKHKLRYDPALPIVCDVKHLLDMIDLGAQFKHIPKDLYRYRVHDTNYSGDLVATEAEFRQLLALYGEDKIRFWVSQTQYSENEKATLLGRILLRMRLMDKARVHFETALARRFSPWLSFYWGIGCYGLLDDPQAAREAFEKGKNALPYKAEFANNLACCLIRLGDKQTARALFEEACALFEGYYDPRYNLAHMDETDFVPRLTPVDTKGNIYTPKEGTR